MDSATDEDAYFDTISVNSNYSKRYLNNNDYIGLSRLSKLSTNTLYKSIPDMEENNMFDTTELQTFRQRTFKVPSRSKSVRTYDEWKPRKWRCFSSDQDLLVDFVLAYSDQGHAVDIEKRRIFEGNLLKTGLILEREESQRIHFVKIHVPHDVVCQYAELLKLRLPIKDEDNTLPHENLVTTAVRKCLDKIGVTVDKSKFPERKYRLTAEFSRDKPYLFDMDAPDFFDQSVKITVASYILEREKFGNGDHDKGIKRLINDSVYMAAYPLHDRISEYLEEYFYSQSFYRIFSYCFEHYLGGEWGEVSDRNSTRHLLLKEWASVDKWVKYQPIDEIKDYFGVKIALYFTWLGFYTHMLIPASIVGIMCVIYAASTRHKDILSDDICNLNITMCPLCDRFCDYWQLKESCTYSRIQHYVDNPATIFFAVFMSLWGALYLELWKRYSAEVTHRWGLTGFDLEAEPPRPEYFARLANAKKKKLNVVTQLQEPVVPFWRVKLPSIILSFTVAIFWVIIAVAVVIGVVIYRMSLLTSDTLYQDKSSYRIYVIPITAAVINLVGIIILNYMYDRLAVWLTEMELQRTQTEFDDSLALKIYMFQFVNYYSSIFYIAFFKGKFVGYPSKYNKIFGYRQEECSPGGCLMELTIQLAIIMIGKQAINTIIEMVIPLLFKMYKSFVVATGIEKESENGEELIISCNQWTEDYKLADLESGSLFAEYLEMVLQYGFVTIFVTAFPLAPLFALINNVFEMRLDAKKFIKYYRRPVPQRVKNIGVWYRILAIVGRIAVVSNALILAFSSHFIPKLIYSMKVNPHHNETGFLEFSLATFNTSDFKPGTAPENSMYNATTCRYAEYRNPPDDPMKYKRPLIYWHIMAARLAFIVVYQNLVGFIITVVEWTIPDVSRKLNDRIKREVYKVNEIIIKNETERAKERNRSLKKRQSVISNATSVYHDANSEFGDDGVSRRGTIYYDSGDS